MNTQNYIWPGLASYLEKDQRLFFGRSIETADLGRQIISSRLTVLFGPSGSGKTSLLQAGVYPVLRKNLFIPVPVRISFPEKGKPIVPVLQQMKNQLIIECKDQEIEIRNCSHPYFSARGDELTLWEWLRKIELFDGNTKWQPVFIFDQFEEVFTLGRHVAGMERFVAELAEAAEDFMPHSVSEFLDCWENDAPESFSKQNYKVVLSLREDYLARLQGMKSVLPSATVRQNQFPIYRLNGEQALEAVLKPAPEGTISAQVAEDIVRFVASASDDDGVTSGSTVKFPLNELEVEPAILSLVCQQLDLKRRAQLASKITIGFVKQSRDQILCDFYENCMQSVSPGLRYFVEDHLLDAEGFRTSEPEANFLQENLDENEIQKLIDQRLIHRIEYYQRSHLELCHDVLTGVVKNSRDLRHLKEKEERQQEEMKKLWKEKKRNAAIAFIFILITILSVLAFIFAHGQKKIAKNKQNELNKSLEQTQKLVNAFYFYDNKFALANKHGSFYYIDKNGDEIGRLGSWIRAEQFDWKGHAKVKNNRGIFLLDTCGNAYNYAMTKDEIDINSKAIELNSLFFFSDIPEEVFTNSDTLEILIMQNNIIQYLSKEIGYLSCLKELYFINNQLIELPKEIGSLQRLRILDLSRNSLSKLPKEIEGLKKLEILNLFNNNIDTITSGIGNLSALTEMNIARNKLSYLPRELGQLQNLIKLDASSNDLDALPIEIWQLTNLIELNMRNNQLSTLPQQIIHLNNLKMLDLSRNKLLSLPEEIGRLENLTVLKLSNNKIEFLPREIGNLQKLKELDLMNIGISQLPSEVENLKNLKLLALQRNMIEYLPSEIGNITNLEVLDLRMNQLTLLPKEVGKLKNLTELHVSLNRLITLPVEIGKLNNLTILRASSNQLASIPKEIGCLQNLKELYLNNNNLTTLPAELGDLSNLAVLDLRNNPLNQLPKEILNLKNIEEIYLQYDCYPCALITANIIKSNWNQLEKLILENRGKNYNDTLLLDNLFLNDIRMLENSNIHHPYFEKIKVLLEE